MLIYLVGYMASGKTTLGRTLAPLLHLPFFDLDDLIEKHTGNAISALFDLPNGAQAFRQHEQTVLRQTFAFNEAVIACGGGTPCFFNNMQEMKRAGTVVWVNTELPLLVERLRKEKTSRPLLAAVSDAELAETIGQHLAERLPVYRQAEIWYNPATETLSELMLSLKIHKNN